MPFKLNCNVFFIDNDEKTNFYTHTHTQKHTTPQKEDEHTNKNKLNKLD